MRLLALLAAGLFAGTLLADDKISKPSPKDMKGDNARPYAGTKVEVKGRLSNYGVDKGTNKWFFHLTLIDDKGADTAVTVYLFFEDKEAAKGLKEKLDDLVKEKKVVPVKDRPVAVVQGICELYAALDPNAKIPPVVLNGTEIIELKEKEKKEEKKDGKDAAKLPDGLKGEWKLMSGNDGRSAFTSAATNKVLKLGDGTAEWDSLPGLAEKAGKGEFVAKETGGKDKKKEGTVELKVGDKVYKGLYKHSVSDTGAMLEIVFGLDGKAAPAAFPKGPADLPKDAVCYAQFDKK